MAGTNKQGTIPEGSDDESIDLSAGFVAKSTRTASEPVKEEMMPDSWMADIQSATEPEKFDFRPEATIPPDGDPKSIVGKPTEVTWFWATPADMQILQLLNFQAEVVSGQPLYLPEQLSNLRVIAVAKKDGKVVGGLMGEESVVVTLIGQMDPEVFESAREIVISRFVAQAFKDGYRFLDCSLPKQLAATLDGALQKVGFKPVDGIQYRLDTGIEADEQNSSRRNRQ